MEPGSSFPFSEEPANCPCHETESKDQFKTEASVNDT